MTIPNYCAQRAHLVFGRWGLRSLVIAKFIPGLDSVTPPLAGIEGSGRVAFLVYDSLGSLLWSALYAGLGYVFATNIAAIAASMAKSGPEMCLQWGLVCCLLVTSVGGRGSGRTCCVTCAYEG